MKIIGQIIAIIVPWQNKSTWQKVGSVLTVIALIASFAATLIPDVPPAPIPVPSPDIIQDNAPVTPQDAPGSLPDVDVPKDTAPSPTGFLVGCSAAQQSVMRVASADAMKCVADCGLKGGSVAITTWGAGQKIDGEGITYDVLRCAMPCLLGLGYVTVKTYSSPQTRYGGSAGEKDVYAADKIEIIVSGKPAVR
jgi:hypothetical protein